MLAGLLLLAALAGTCSAQPAADPPAYSMSPPDILDQPSGSGESFMPSPSDTSTALAPVKGARGKLALFVQASPNSRVHPLVFGQPR